MPLLATVLLATVPLVPLLPPFVVPEVGIADVEFAARLNDVELEYGAL